MIDHNIQLAKGSLLQNGKFRIEKVLGQGGFGITYLATQEILERKVCIKEFFMRDFCSRSESDSSVTLGTSANKELMERYLAKFVKEARTISQLEHPNIIHIHDIFKENGTAYYVMDYIEGESLSDLVKRRGALPEEEAMTYIRAVAEALKYVHARSINHLDVKPGNIMVRASDHHVFLLDFGLSKQYDAAGNQTSSTPLGISHGYAPIEQYSPEGIKSFSPQTDIYSLGATLYYLVTGLTPPSASELFASDLNEFPATLSVVVREAILWVMKPQKKDRPQNMDEFLIILGYIEEAKNSKEQINTSLQEEKEGTKSASSNTNREYRIMLEKAAELGDVDAQCNLGNMYVNGEGVSQNYTQAVKWYFMAAEQGNANAQYNLGYMYENGLGVSQDYSEAVRWYLKAAEQGDAEAQYNLGYMYANGKGVSQDHTEALKWYLKAAEQGDVKAQCNLGNMYEYGKGVSQDYSEAVRWYLKAAEQGDVDAQYNLGNMYVKGEGVSRNYSEAVKWFRKAAEQGNANAQNNLGVMYGNGLGVLQDYSEAVKWYLKAAELGDAEAQYNLGYMYANGKGVSQDHTEALKWYLKAAEQGDVKAQCNLGYMYENGLGVSQNYTEALKWFRKAAKQGDANAKRKINKRIKRRSKRFFAWYIFIFIWLLVIVGNYFIYSNKSTVRLFLLEKKS